MELAAGLPPVLGDRVQLQQVILNLIMNGIEAMASVTDRPRELLISSRQHESDKALVAVRDSGVGLGGRTSKRSSTLSTRPSRRGWAWGWRSVALLLRITAGSYGPRRMKVPARPFSLRF